MVFHWSWSDSLSPQVSRTRLRILAVLCNLVVWIVSTRPPTSKSSRPFNNPLIIMPNWHNRYFHVPHLFQFPSKVEVLILHLTFFQIYSVVRQDSKVNNFANSLFLLIIIRSGFLAGIRWSVFMLKSHRSLCVAFLEQLLGCAYTVIIIHSLELFTSALANGFSLESELQQVSSSLQDSS